MVDKEEKKKIKLLKEGEFFRRNAFILIKKMVKLNTQTRQDTSMLVDEILHCLFFLGLINKPPFSPRDLLGDDDDILDYLKNEYPEPFRLYSTQLPRRSPFSCLLDMVVRLYGHEEEDRIKDRLLTVVRQMKEGPSPKILFSFTICISQICDSRKYYGVSMSTRGRPAGKILVAASCFGYWHRLVADAVTHYLDKDEKSDSVSRNIQLPLNVKCETFNISEGKPMVPCRSCSELFGLDTTETKCWPHGNCAEVESLSNLFKEESQVMEQLRPEENVPEESRPRAKMIVYEYLKQQLKMFDKFKWDGKIYPNLNPNKI